MPLESIRQRPREPFEAGERLLKEMAEHDLAGLELLAVWIDGLELGGHHVICAVGVDARGYNHVLGLRQRATENAAVAKALLGDLVRRGLNPGLIQVVTVRRPSVSHDQVPASPDSLPGRLLISIRKKPIGLKTSRSTSLMLPSS